MAALERIRSWSLGNELDYGRFPLLSCQHSCSDVKTSPAFSLHEAPSGALTILKLLVPTFT